MYVYVKLLVLPSSGAVPITAYALCVFILQTVTIVNFRARHPLYIITDDDQCRSKALQ